MSSFGPSRVLLLIGHVSRVSVGIYALSRRTMIEMVHSGSIYLFFFLILVLLPLTKSLEQLYVKPHAACDSVLLSFYHGGILLWLYVLRHYQLHHPPVGR